MHSIKQLSSPYSGVFGTGFGKVAAAAIMSLFFLLTANAAQAQLRITGVFVNDPAAGQMRIVGEDLVNGPNLIVTLGGSGPLVTFNESDVEISAILPDPLPPGDYLLTISTGNINARSDFFNVTVAVPFPLGLPVSGIVLWDETDACPTGFTRVEDADGRFLRAADTAGDEGGNASHNHTAGTFSAGAHRHNLEADTPEFAPVDDNSGGENFNARTEISGEGSVTGQSDNASNLPPFKNFLLCRLD